MPFDFGNESLDDGFVNLAKKAKSIIPIIQNYKCADLAVAIFAIASWRDNRSAQESCLALNRALIQCSTFGSETIGSYSELSTFFQKIEPTLKTTHFDDSVLNDFGEVQFCFHDRFYPIITGTGHTGSVYAAIQYLECLSEEIDREIESKAVLEYIDTMIDALGTTNISKREQSAIVFEIPTEERFIATKHYVDSGPTTKLDRSIIQMLLATKQTVVKTHFIHKEQMIYPLFNPSFALDYYTELLDRATFQNIINHIHATLFKRIEAIHLSSSEKAGDFLLYKPKVAVQNNVISSTEPTFLYLQGNIAVIFLDVASMEKNEIDEYIGQLKQFHLQNQLGFVDLSHPIGKGRFLGINISKEQPLFFIPFNHFTNLNTTYMQFGSKGNQLVLTALDLMFILSDAEDMDEILKFLDYHSQEQAQIFLGVGFQIAFRFGSKSRDIFQKEHKHIT